MKVITSLVFLIWQSFSFAQVTDIAIPISFVPIDLIAVTEPTLTFPNCTAIDPNSQLGCTAGCQTCSEEFFRINYGIQCYPVPCPFGACYCKNGYFRDNIYNTGKCVPFSTCNPKRDCPANSVPGCDPCNTCQRFVFGSPNDPCPIRCDPTRACKCIDGYALDPNGTCIRYQDCQKAVCPVNQEPGCDPCNTCTNALTPGPKEPCVAKCRVGDCKCVKGTYRDVNGNCVTLQQCRATQQVCLGANRVPGCAPCDTCERALANRTTGPECNVFCPAGSCRCAPGYYSDANGNCLTLDQCRAQNVTTTTLPPIILPNCTASDPNKQPGCKICASCSQQIKLRTTNSSICPIGVCDLQSCTCKDDYYFDDILGTQKCIPYSQCVALANLTNPITNCTARDPNSERGCKICDSCKQQIQGTLACPIGPCLPNSCSCKIGYYRDDILGTDKCIKFSQCLALAALSTTTIRPFTNCTAKDPNSERGCKICGSCKEQIQNRTMSIIDCPIGPCYFDSCRCKNDYYTDDILNTGKCIPYSQCLALDALTATTTALSPITNCTAIDPTKVNGCKGCATCTAQIDHQVNGTFCPVPPCLPGVCTCKDGYFYDNIQNTGKCIPYSQCLALAGTNATTTPRPCPKNSVRGCDPCNTCQRAVFGSPNDPCPIRCDPLTSCKCINGRSFNKKGKCVTYNQCVKSLCPKYKEPGCDPCNTCERALATEPQPICVAKCVVGACKCVKGRYLDPSGNCVTIERCREIAERLVG